MAKNEGSLRQISVQDGGVTVTLGRTQTTVPADQIDTIIRALEAAKMILGLEGATEVEVAPAPRARAASAKVVVEAAPRGRGGRRKKEEAATSPRRSRKRVGDALAEWFRENPGWHSTQELLDVVSAERMTDASPKRALMIALGKQRDSIFASDGQGNWKLAGDPAPAPAPEPRVRKKPGRKPGSGKAKAKAKAKAAPARGKRPTGRPRGRPPKSASADKEGSAVPEEVTPPPSAKVLRVKRGQARKEAMLTPQELEARRQAATAVDTLHFRWSSASRAEREHVRRKLFGDGDLKAG
jgi:hypothetical protein